jgi:uncharacterized LabA/DUF88 family protein
MKGEVQSKAYRLAVLIDADNANASLVEPLLKEIAQYGTASVKRIYGDWTRPQLNNWKDKLHKFAIQPIQQFSYTSGKNATDSALIIDAMDLLYTNKVEGFCIVSSDSDFTRLACRIREAGLLVYGFGEKKTPEPFQKACDKFTYTENLEDIEEKERHNSTDTVLIKGEKTSNKTHQKKSDKTSSNFKRNQELLKLVKNAYETSAQEDGWANLAELGGQLNKLSSSFDSRNYGYKKLGELIRSIDMFEVKEIPHEKTPAVKALYIKFKS